MGEEETLQGQEDTTSRGVWENMVKEIKDGRIRDNQKQSEEVRRTQKVGFGLLA